MDPKINIDALAKRILNRCKKDKECRRLQVPLEEYKLRVLYYTGLPISVCVECSDDCPVTSSNDDSIGNSDHIAIMLCLREMYKQKALPKMQDLYEAVQASRNQNCKKYTASYDTFSYEVFLLGYRYISLVNGDFMIMEDPKLTFERYHYLKKLLTICKKSVNIYYLDERMLGPKLFTKNSDLVQKDYDRQMLFYAISRQGFVQSMSCVKTSVHNYIDWITETLLPNLKPSSVIIINPHHGQSKNKTITKYHSMKDMLTWLRNHNIPCSNEMHKAELYELIDKSNLNPPQSIVENILKASGHTVLILPSSLQNFTPTELLWRDIQTQWQKNPTKPCTILTRICDYIESVSEYQFSSYEDTVFSQKILIYDIDLDVDKALVYYNLDPSNLYG